MMLTIAQTFEICYFSYRKKLLLLKSLLFIKPAISDNGDAFQRNLERRGQLLPQPPPTNAIYRI